MTEDGAARLCEDGSTFILPVGMSQSCW